MKVSLSASFWNEPEVRAELMTCQMIYTTQGRNYARLQEVFGEDRMRMLPECRPSTIAFFKKRHEDEGDTVILYGDLYKIHSKNFTRRCLNDEDA